MWTRMTVHRQQTRHQYLTIIRANEHFHDCSGGHLITTLMMFINFLGNIFYREYVTS